MRLTTRNEFVARILACQDRRTAAGLFDRIAEAVEVETLAAQQEEMAKCLTTLVEQLPADSPVRAIFEMPRHESTMTPHGSQFYQFFPLDQVFPWQS